MREVRLVCEGSPGKVDVRVLDAIVAQRLGVRVRIEPAGGDKGLGSVRQYLEATNRAIVLTIEDRNYRSRGDALATWNGGRTLMWTRHEIENYLLEPQVVFAAFRRFAATVRDDWAKRLPDSLAGVEELLRGLAEPLREEHAGSLLFEEIRASLGSVGVQRPKQSSIEADGWILCIQKELARVGEAGSSVEKRAAGWSERLAARSEAIRTEVYAPEFLQGRHLQEMGGHELMSRLVRTLYGLGAVRLTTQDLEGALIEALGDVYTEGTLYKTDERDDFAALRDKLVAAGAAVKS